MIQVYKMRKGLNNKGNMYFGVFIVVLLIIALFRITIVASERLDNIDLQIGLLGNNIEVLDSRVDSDKYFVFEVGRSLEDDVEYELFEEFANDLSTDEKYELNKILDIIIEKGDDAKEKDVLTGFAPNGIDGCSYAGKRIVDSSFDCFRSEGDIAISFVEKEVDRYMGYYRDSRRENKIDFVGRFNFAFDYGKEGFLIYGFMDNIEKYIVYEDADEYDEMKREGSITREGDGFIKTD